MSYRVGGAVLFNVYRPDCLRSINFPTAGILSSSRSVGRLPSEASLVSPTSVRTMCDVDVTSRTLLSDRLAPQCDGISSSSCKDESNALQDLGTMFMATIVQLEATFCNELWLAFCAELENFRRSSRKDRSNDLQDLCTIFVATIVQLGVTFCNELWPAFCAELQNSSCRMMDLEKEVNTIRTQLEERKQLELEVEAEIAHLRAENGVLSAEREQLWKDLYQARGAGMQQKGTNGETDRLIQENQNLQMKVQSLTEENLKGDRERQSLSEELDVLWKEAKLKAAKHVFLEAEDKQYDRMIRSQREKSRQIQARRNLPLNSHAKPRKDEGPLSLSIAGRDAGPVSSNHPQDSKKRDLVQSVASLQGQGQAVGCSSSDLDKEAMRGRSLVGTEATKAVTGAVVVIPLENPLENPPSGQPMRQVEVKIDVKELVSFEEPKVKCDVESSPRPAAGFVDSDETTLGLASRGAFQEHGVEGSLEDVRSGQSTHKAEAVLDALGVGCCESPKGGSVSAGFVDSDRTTLGIAQEDPLQAATFQDYPLISISSEPQGGACDETLQLACKTGNIVTSHGAVEQKEEQKAEQTKGVVHDRAPLGPISLNPRNSRPTSKISVPKKFCDNPKEQRWRQTRLRAEPSDRDPHDSFLDTPREKALAQIAADRASREEAGSAAGFLAVARVGPAPVTNKLEGVNFVEARDGGEKAAVRRQDPPRSASSRSITEEASNTGRRRPGEDENAKALSSKAPPFKFNEPVRKKRERENLLATDCKQCKAFHDAVATGDGDAAEKSRCKDHDSSSRHRFKYLPPPTPEGFWNIGFDDSINPPDHT